FWRTDGTEEGTYIIQDVEPSPGEMGTAKNCVFLRASDQTHGGELWMYLLNGNCVDALQVTPGNLYSHTNYGATGNLVSNCAYNDYSDVWYSFKPTTPGQYTINVISDDFDTTLAVYNACGGNIIDCNDDFNGYSDSLITLDAVKGKTYYIRVAGYNGGMGLFDFWIDAGSCTEYISSDLNMDCAVNMEDFVIMASEWLSCRKAPSNLCN
ncbi:MAG: hypothetical protein ABFD79_06145, partial [Phycisphaerales bacterium]